MLGARRFQVAVSLLPSALAPIAAAALGLTGACTAPLGSPGDPEEPLDLSCRTEFGQLDYVIRPRVYYLSLGRGTLYAPFKIMNMVSDGSTVYFATRYDVGTVDTRAPDDSAVDWLYSSGGASGDEMRGFVRDRDILAVSSKSATVIDKATHAKTDLALSTDATAVTGLISRIDGNLGFGAQSDNTTSISQFFQVDFQTGARSALGAITRADEAFVVGPDALYGVSVTDGTHNVWKMARDTGAVSTVPVTVASTSVISSVFGYLDGDLFLLATEMSGEMSFLRVPTTGGAPTNLGTYRLAENREYGYMRDTASVFRVDGGLMLQKGNAFFYLPDGSSHAMYSVCFKVRWHRVYSAAAVGHDLYVGMAQESGDDTPLSVGDGTGELVRIRYR